MNSQDVLSGSKRLHFLDLPLDVGADIDLVCAKLRERSGPFEVSFINPYAWAVAKRDPSFIAMLEKLSLVMADGVGVSYACRALTRNPCNRVSFDMTSLANPFFKTLQDANLSLALVGGELGVDESVKDKLEAHYSGLRIVETTHGYDDLEPKVATIMAKAPDAVLVGMGSPRQERFLIALREAGYRGFAITCGGFFDQYLVSDKYYPDWINRWNLRFLYRLYKEPGRLWRRYLIDYQVYLKRLLREILIRRQ
ncbi:MAG: WecB/TagA/CpsF family glycosyltransferase [Bdellovibrionales bacterium]